MQLLGRWVRQDVGFKFSKWPWQGDVLAVASSFAEFKRMQKDSNHLCFARKVAILWQSCEMCCTAFGSFKDSFRCENSRIMVLRAAQQDLVRQRFRRTPRSFETLLGAESVAPTEPLQKMPLRTALDSVVDNHEVAFLRGAVQQAFSSGFVPSQGADQSLAPFTEVASDENLLGQSACELILCLSQRFLRHAILAGYAGTQGLEVAGALLAKLQPPAKVDLLQNPLGGSKSYGYWAPHVDRANVEKYDVSSILYLSTLGRDFKGGAFAFNDSDKDRLVEPKEGRLLFLMQVLRTCIKCIQWLTVVVWRYLYGSADLEDWVTQCHPTWNEETPGKGQNGTTSFLRKRSYVQDS